MLFTDLNEIENFKLKLLKCSKIELVIQMSKINFFVNRWYLLIQQSYLIYCIVFLLVYISPFIRNSKLLLQFNGIDINITAFGSYGWYHVINEFLSNKVNIYINGDVSISPLFYFSQPILCNLVNLYGFSKYFVCSNKVLSVFYVMVF